MLVISHHATADHFLPSQAVFILLLTSHCHYFSFLNLLALPSRHLPIISFLLPAAVVSPSELAVYNSCKKDLPEHLGCVARDLFATRRRADDFNDSKMRELDGPETTYHARDTCFNISRVAIAEGHKVSCCDMNPHCSGIAWGWRGDGVRMA